MNRKKILIVEDERIIAEDIKSALLSFDYEVLGICSSGELALEKLKSITPDLIMMDIMLEGELDGIQTSEIILKEKNIPIIYLTAYADEATLERAKLTTPYGYLLKPFEDRELNASVEMTFYRHDMEIKLERSEKRFRGLFEQSNDAIFIHNADGQIINANKKACELLGYYFQQLTAMQLSSFIPEHRLIYTLEKFQQIKETKAISFETQFKKESGHIIDVDISMSYIYADENLIQCIVRDITDKKKAEREIRMLHQAIEQSHVAILITNLKGDIIYANKTVAAQSEYNIGELLDMNVQKLYLEQEDIQQSWDMLSMGIELSGEYEMKKKSGETYWEFASITPIVNAKGQTKHFLKVAEDITERMTQEKNHQEMLQNLSATMKELKDYSQFSNQNITNAINDIETSLRDFNQSSTQMDNSTVEDLLEKISAIKMMVSGMKEFTESIITDEEIL